MADEKLQAAMDRIEAALARLETVMPRAVAAAQVPQHKLAEAYALLDERHGLLRLRIQETIDRLDTLIGEPEEAAA